MIAESAVLGALRAIKDPDLNRDIVRVALQDAGLETVSQVSIDDTWSALRAKAV